MLQSLVQQIGTKIGNRESLRIHNYNIPGDFQQAIKSNQNNRNHLIGLFKARLPFKRNKEEGRPWMVKRKLHGALDESSANRDICKSDVTVYNL